MIKLLFLVVVICGFGSVLCETHHQQIAYAHNLTREMEVEIESIKIELRRTDERTEEQRKLIFLHANLFNLKIHFILDSLQYFVSKNEQQSVALQEVVLKLNNITNELEKSFESGVSVVKAQLVTSLGNVLVEAKNLQKIIEENSNLYYTATVLRFLDDLLTATNIILTRANLRVMNKATTLITIPVIRTMMIYVLSNIDSEDINVRKDIVRYTSKATSTISEYGHLLKDLTYNTKKYNEVKEVIYSFGKMVADSEEFLYYNENSFQKIKQLLGAIIVHVADQLTKITNAGFSVDGSKDENLIYVILPDMFAHAAKLQRNLVKTENYINHDSDY